MLAKSKKLSIMKSLSVCQEKNRASGMSCLLCIEKEIKKTKTWEDGNSWLRYPEDS